MENSEFDYLIVGQGLAGTSLAIHLLELGKKVLVIDDPSFPSSSKVAAGIFNPLTGKKLVKTWLADALFPFAKQFYTRMEEKFQADFFHHTPVYRPYRSLEEQNNYLAQSVEPSLSTYIGNESNQPDLSAYIHASYGGLEVVGGGWVDLPVFLESARRYLVAQGVFVESKFESDQLELVENGVIWQGKSFGKLMLCQGYESLSNTYFNWLPFAPVKGQILDIETEATLQNYIVNQGIFILPLDGSHARVGATYSWDNLNWESTEDAKVELQEKLENIFKGSYKITVQRAGIRPSSKDRRPIIGMHPVYTQIGLLNGLGTKGVTLAPYFGKELADHLESGKELNPLVNIKRYFSLYFR